MRNIKLHIISHSKLYLLVVFFLLLTTTYGVTLPLGRGYDEFAHFQYVRFIAEHLRPPLTEAERGQGGYKARNHPPFYHGLAGLLLSWVDSKDTLFKRVSFGEIPQHALIYEVRDIHWFLETEIMKFPYQGAILLWHLSRLYSSLLAAGTIIITYFIILELYPGQKTRALLGATVLAFIPRFVFTSSVTSDDNMLAILMAIYLFLMVRLIKGNLSWRNFIFLGITLGLAITTKFSVALVPITMTVVFYILAWRKGWSWGVLIKRIAVVVVTILIVSSWWFIIAIWNFNKIEELGLTAGLINSIVPNVANNVSGADFLAIVQGTESIEREPLMFGQWLANFGKSFWAVPFISQFNGFPLAPYAFWLALIGTGLVVFGLVKAWQQGDELQRILLGFFLLHTFSFFPLMLIRYYLNGIIFETSQGRHVLMPAASAIGILLMVGWTHWLQPKKLNLYRPVLPALLLFWSMAHLHSIQITYLDPLPLSINAATRLPIKTPVNLMLFDSFELQGYNVEILPSQSLLEVTLIWQAYRPSNKDYLIEVRLVSEEGQTASSWIGHSANGFYPTRVWNNGEVINDRIKLPIGNLIPGSYTLEAYLLEAYQRPLQRATGPLFSVPIDIKNPSSNRPPGLKRVAIESGNETFWVGYQLWPFNFFSFNRPQYHYRATIPILGEADISPHLGQKVTFKLVGPDGTMFEPVVEEGNLINFLVEADWPSGAYRIKVELEQAGKIVGENLSAPLLQVVKRDRTFTVPSITRRVDANFYNQVELLGYDLPASSVKQGEGLSVFVHWQDLQVLNANLVMFNHLYDKNGKLWTSFDHILPPYYGGTIMWVPGEVTSDGYTIPIPPEVPDGIYTLRVGLFLGLGEDAWVPVPLMNNGQVSDVTYVTLGPIKIGSSPKEVLALDPNPQYLRNDTLGELIKLRGYDLTPSLETSQIDLTLYWESLAVTENNYTTFVHLQDGTGQIIAQKDGMPADGAYPTSLWDVGEVVKDNITLSLPPDLSIDNYNLLVGMYDFTTGERLPVSNTPDNAILLTSFEIAGLLK